MAAINLDIQEVSGHKTTYLVDKTSLQECLPDGAMSRSRSNPRFDFQHYKQAQFYRTNNRIFVLLDTYLLGKFVKELETSSVYRNAWLSNVWNLQKGTTKIHIYEIMPEKPYIDSTWCKKLELLARERQELEHTMSWLSTLGGAFSALGEDFSRCALIAGRISVEQFRLATRLGDPDTQSRCRLYLALSLMQQGKLRIARKIIQREHALALSVPEDLRDIRLVRMCHGMWAKLKYLYYLRKVSNTK